MNSPGSHKKVWKLWAWLINALKSIWQIIRQTTRGKIYQVGEKICSLPGKLLSVLNQGTFGHIRIKNGRWRKSNLCIPVVFWGWWTDWDSAGVELCHVCLGTDFQCFSLITKMLVSFDSGSSFTASLGKRKGFLGREVRIGIFNFFWATLLFSSAPSRQPFCLKHTYLVFFFFFFPSFSLYV